MASLPKRASADNTDKDLASANVSKKPRVQIDIAIVDNDDEGDSEAGATGKQSNNKQFAPGAIFAATRIESAKLASSDSADGNSEPSANGAETGADGSDAAASTLPKRPLPGVVRVPAQQLQQEQKDQQQQQQLQQQRILVSKRQRGNAVLRLIRSVPWEFSDSVDPADFILGRTACAMFLSVRYHCLHPDYVHQRFKQLGPKEYDLRILLLLVDSQEYSDAVRELNRICLMAGSTLILAWSNEEAARYLESFKSLEKKPADSLMERPADDWAGQLRDVLGCVRGVSRSDAACLAANFGTFEAMIGASSAQLERCPGLGPKKAARLTAVFGQNFTDS